VSPAKPPRERQARWSELVPVRTADQALLEALLILLARFALELLALQLQLPDPVVKIIQAAL
jgi:hypothetical protein